MRWPRIARLKKHHRDARALFDAAWYLDANPDVRAAGVDPFRHYLEHGWREHRRASPLFDSVWYVARYPEVGQARGNPLLHFVQRGASEGKNPNAYFDTNWYLARNPGAQRSGLNPLIYYLRHNAREGRDPSLAFSAQRYLLEYPDVAAAGVDALVHYLTWGAGEGRRRFAHDTIVSVSEMYATTGDIAGAAMSSLREDGLRAVQNVFGYMPLNVSIDPRRAARPTLWILLPALLRRYATGGPNTAYILGSLLARAGIQVNFVSVEEPPDKDLGPLKTHLKDLTGIDVDAFGVEFLDASQRERPFAVGYNDVLLATAWWTAQPARSVAGLLRTKRFYYLIQDYECLFYPTSERQAVARQTYDFNHLPIINSVFLKDHLVQEKAGRFADPKFAADAIVFEPAVDRAHFYPEPAPSSGPRRLLFYARPTMAERNLFGLGVAALRAAVEGGLFGDDGWEFIGMGENFEPIPLGRRHVLRPMKWLDFAGYGALMRSADLLLSLMMSPHPSYPPLEMAACGGVVVTTEYGSKTAARLRDVSPNIFAVPPVLEELVLALTRGVMRREANRHNPSAPTLSYPATWVESLSSVVPRLLDELRSDGIEPHRPRLPAPTMVLPTGTPDVPEDGTVPASYQRLLLSRRNAFRDAGTDGLVSLLTIVGDAPASHLADLAHSIFGQDTTNAFEWLIVDRGTADPATRDALSQIAADPRVRRIEPAPEQGRLACLHVGLSRATSRYVVPLDPDLLLLPDCLRILQAFLEQAGFPPALYVDTDRTGDGVLAKPTRLPDWDPVLFLHAPRLVGLAAFDREVALKQGCFTAADTDGAERWDALLRLAAAGLTPRHLPQIVCARRPEVPAAASAPVSPAMTSTPASPAAVRAGLDSFLQATRPSVRHGLLDDPGATAPRIRLGATVAASRIAACPLPEALGRHTLRQRLEALPPQADIVMLVSDACRPTSAAPLDHVGALFDLFPDTVMVGGRIHDGVRIVGAGYVFGYGGFIGCPDRGRAIDDPGYLELMRTPRSVAAVSARYGFVARAFLHQALAGLPDDVDVPLLGPWLGAVAARQGGRVIFSPFCDALVESSLRHGPDEAGQAELAVAFGDLSGNPVGYARGLSLSGLAPYAPAEDAPLKPVTDYATFLRRRLARRATERMIDAGLPSTIEVVADAGSGPGSEAGVDAGLRRVSEVAADAGLRPASEVGVDAKSRPTPEVGVDAGSRPGSEAGVDAGLRRVSEVAADARSRRASEVGVDAKSRPASVAAVDAGSRRVAGMAFDAASAPTISVLTTVYARTDAALFEATAAAMAAQTRPPLEWLVLAHGPIGDDLAAILEGLSAAGAIRWLKHEVNLGIHGGLRHCLERAAGDFVLALDADDVLTPDALALLADAVRRDPRARIVYSDEDFLVDGTPTAPFYRPDFDPVHLRAHSFIWHAILFHRQEALELGVYTAAEVEFALDWDVLLRFEAAGHTPVHVGEVLYHWRQHARSLSHSGTTYDGTLRSIRGALEMIRQRSGRADDLAVEPYPLDTGMPDYHLRRLERHAPAIGHLSMRHTNGRDPHGDAGFPFRRSVTVTVGRGPQGRATLLRALADMAEEFVVLQGPGVEIEGAPGLWQALKHLELVPQVIGVGGALCSLAGQVVLGAPVRLDGATLFDPLAGRSALARGGYSINVLKPHCIDAPAIDLMVARRVALVAALEAAPPRLALRSLGWWLGAFAARTGLLVAYEPLLRGFVRDEAALLGDSLAGLQTSMSAFPSASDTGDPPRRGIARFEMHARLHGR